MNKFQYKEDDKVGKDTLDVISAADKFNKWMYNTIATHCEGDILEIGSGIGNISKYFLEDGASIMLSDIRTQYCDSLRTSFAQHKNLLGVEEIDLVSPEFDAQFSKFYNRFDSIFALNVVEHIEDDVLALQNIKKLLKPTGKVVILVPAYQSLYNQFDKELEHYRRYTKSTMAQRFQDAAIPIIKQEYFNLVGILGWFVTGKLMAKDSIPEGQMGLYNALVPIIKIIDKITLKKVGLSVITVGNKN